MKKILFITLLLALPWVGSAQIDSLPHDSNVIQKTYFNNINKAIQRNIKSIILNPTTDTIKLGLALSGGAATGYAHIGLLQALDEANVKIDCISGTSMGAIVGMFYAAGYTPKEIVQMAKEEKMDQLRGVIKSNHKRDGGFADYHRLRRIIYKHIPSNNFDSLLIPFYCCATDINNVRPTYIGHGNMLAQYVTASASMPVIFAPVVVDGITYLDGGVLNNLPIEPLIAEGCNVRIGSYIVHDTVARNLDKRIDIWLRTFTMSSDANMLARLPLCTYLVGIDPHGLTLADFDYIDDFFAYGYQAGKQLLKEHPEILKHQR